MFLHSGDSQLPTKYSFQNWFLSQSCAFLYAEEMAMMHKATATVEAFVPYFA